MRKSLLVFHVCISYRFGNIQRQITAWNLGYGPLRSLKIVPFESLVTVSNLLFHSKVKVKEGHTPKERRRGAHLPLIGRCYYSIVTMTLSCIISQIKRYGRKSRFLHKLTVTCIIRIFLCILYALFAYFFVTDVEQLLLTFRNSHALLLCSRIFVTVWQIKFDSIWFDSEVV